MSEPERVSNWMGLADDQDAGTDLVAWNDSTNLEDVSESKRDHEASADSMPTYRPLEWVDRMYHIRPERDRIHPLAVKGIRGVLAGDMPWPLVLIGEPGSGKTCAAMLMLGWLENHGASVWYTSATDLAYELAEAMADRARWSTGYRKTVADVWASWDQAAFAVMDELGARTRVSDHAYDTVKRAIDSRFARPTLYISNLGQTELAKVYDDRIVSRLSEGTVVVISGDQRKGVLITE